MNENIGAKGGNQDRKRNLIIKNKKLKRLKKLKEEELEKKIEKEIKKNDIKTFIKVIPLVVFGESFKILFSKTKKTPEIPENTTKNQHQSPSNNLISIPTTKKENNIFTQNKTSPLNYQNYPPSSENDTIHKNNLSIKKEKEQIKEEPIKTRKIIQPHISIPNIKILNITNKEKQKESIEENEENKQYNQSKQENITHIYKTNKKNIIKNINEHLDPKANNSKKKSSKKENATSKKFEKVTNAKLIEAYEKRLQDARYSIRSLIYEYNALVSESKDIYTSENAEIILEKLNLVIRKLEELKSKITIEDLKKYDDAYIYHLVDEYMKEFDDKNFIDEIKDSDLYIIISEKLEELDKKKDNLQNIIETKKEKVTEDEENLQRATKDYQIFSYFDKELIKFQNEQEKLLKELEINIQNSVSISEKVEIEAVTMNNQAKRLLELMSIQMMIPGARSSTNIITATMLYMYFIHQMLHPDIKTKKYKVINVEDYSNNIKDSISQLDDINNKLQTTSKKLNDIVKDFEKKYEKYFGIIPEYEKLLNNLKKVQDNLNEKEYELEKLKQKQLKNLETNNQKIKKLDNKIENQEKAA